MQDHEVKLNLSELDPSISELIDELEEQGFEVIWELDDDELLED